MSLFYNYKKEGPGVRKYEPGKKTFFRFFECLFRYFWKLIPVSFMYWLIGLIPCGFSAVGITAVTRTLSRNKHSFGLHDFFSTIKKNWRQAISVGLINNIITVMLLLAIRFYYHAVNPESIFGLIALGASIFILVYFIVMKFYIWFMVITFDLKLNTIYKNAFKFVIINLKNNAVMLFGILVYWAINIALIMLLPESAILQAILTLLLIVFYPSYRYLLIAFGIFESIKKYMIDPYYEEHPDADIEFRRDLGIYVDNTEESDFTDVI